ncbi:MAG: histidine phosphatase family protein [Actinomycetota bacterium]
MSSQVVLIRHGQTEWSMTGRHTGRSDIPLTLRGQEQALTLGDMLASFRFDLTLTSPAVRARETSELAGYAAEVEPDLAEWDYGAYEGRRTAEIRLETPGWSIWTHGVLGGETVDQVGARADRVIERTNSVRGSVALFGHGHALRILGARWLGLPPSVGAGLVLETAAISVLGWERGHRAIILWNEVGHLRGAEEPS